MHHTLYARIVMPQHTHFMHDNTPEGHVTSRIRRVVERYNNSKAVQQHRNGVTYNWLVKLL